MPTIGFYFDFMSPYGYLGAEGIEALAARRGLDVDWRPVLLGITVLKVMGLKGLADTPLKRDYVARDVPRLARWMGVPFARGREGPMVSLPAMRTFVWLKDRDPDAARRFGRAVFRAQWAEGRDLSEPEALAAFGRTLGIDPSELLAAIGDPTVKERLKAAVDAAVGAGVFGVPTFAVDGELFWGADRLPMVERWIETGGW